VRPALHDAVMQASAYYDNPFFVLDK